jgi:hypothetical protein
LRVYDKDDVEQDVRSDGLVPPGSRIEVDTVHFHARIETRGYVSGVAAGSFLDKKTEARDLGFGLDIVDFLLEPAKPGEQIAKGQYEFGPESAVHGNIPKRYVEGPQICTQAKDLPAKIFHGDGFAAVQLTYRWNVAYAPHARAGSTWEQLLVFPENERFFLGADRVTVASESPALFLRIDMPGHIKHEDGMGFDHVYLSYNDPAFLPSTEFNLNFPPDARFLYKRNDDQVPERFIRAYQVDLANGDEGPWLAGITLNPADVYQAWSHQRGYVCMIQEIGGRAAKPGDVFGACYAVGWFDDIAAMTRVQDRYKGWSGLVLDGRPEKPVGYRGLKQGELAAVVP